MADCLKELRQRYCSLKRTMTRDSCKDYGQGVVATSWQGLEMRVHSVARSLCLAQKTFVYQYSLSLLRVNCLPILSSPKQLPLTFPFVYRSGLLLMTYSVFLGLSHVYVLLYFYPVNLSHINLILQPPTKT